MRQQEYLWNTTETLGFQTQARACFGRVSLRTCVLKFTSYIPSKHIGFTWIYMLRGAAFFRGIQCVVEGFESVLYEPTCSGFPAPMKPRNHENQRWVYIAGPTDLRAIFRSV